MSKNHSFKPLLLVIQCPEYSTRLGKGIILGDCGVNKDAGQRNLQHDNHQCFLQKTFWIPGHATPTGPGSTGAIQPFSCILPRQSHSQLQPPTAPWLQPPRSWVVLRTGLAHRRCGHKTKTGQRGKSYKIPHKTPVFPGS